MDNNIYKETSYPISMLVWNIQNWTIALPELQRPYVWERTRVRNFFDSLYKWYPTWLIILLENDTEAWVKAIWWWELEKTPNLSVIDGQQRLTSLFATLTWTPIVNSKLKEEKIVISFNPITESFEVADASTKSWDWIYDIKEIISWTNLLTIFNEYITNYKKRCDEQWISEDERIRDDEIMNRIQKVSNIKTIKIQAIEILKDTDLEVVSDIFLRINSWWIKLNNSDFILTLMSVYWNTWREQVEKFSIWTKAQNDIMWLSASDIVRVLLWVGFKRARLDQIYKFLRWNYESFNKLSDVITNVTNTHYWEDYLTILKDAWFINWDLISQWSLAIACYIFYLIWLKEYWLGFTELAPVIKRYYVAMFLTWKYVNSMETALEKDLNTIKDIHSKEWFIEFLDNEIAINLTNDTWNIKFREEIKTSSSRAPLAIAFNAAQIYFHKPVLFRTIPVSKYFVDSKEKSEIDSHHIFPKQYLIDTFWADTMKKNDINQIANKVWAYNSDNKFISKKAPKEYYNEYTKNWTISWDQNLLDNCIPLNFTELEYDQFLDARRELMLKLIRKYYEDIANLNSPIKTIDYKPVIQEWESRTVEFKSSLRWDYYQNKDNPNLKFQVIKTIAAFLNTDWWTLFVWVNDEWEILWEENDINTYWDKSWDSLLKDVDNIIWTHFSDSRAYIKAERVVIDGKEVLVFTVGKSNQPVYFMYNWKKEFYVRNAASSIWLDVEDAYKYTNSHFKSLI